MLLSQDRLKRVVDKVGIDVKCFKPHSTSTSTSSNAKGDYEHSRVDTK